MTRPVVPELPPYPQRGEGFDTFTAKINARFAAEPEHTNKINELGGYLDTLSEGVEQNKVASETAQEGAETALVAAAEARDLAAAWAAEDEDVEVAPGEYSAKHHAAKSEMHKDTAQVAAAAAQAAAGLPSLAGNARKRLGVNATENGVEWLHSVADYQEFTASGTWIKPEGCEFVYAEMVGAGASGAASVSSTDGSVSRPGGEGGHFVSKIYAAAELGSTEAVIIGAGGASVVAVDTFAVSGNDGGDTTFAGCVAKGGLAPTSAAQTTRTGSIFPATGGAGGLQDGSPGQGGGGGGGTNSGSRNGAESLANNGRGGDGARGASPQTAGSGASPGGGGGSAKVNTGSVGTATSGPGGDGIVRIWSW